MASREPVRFGPVNPDHLSGQGGILDDIVYGDTLCVRCGDRPREFLSGTLCRRCKREVAQKYSLSAGQAEVLFRPHIYAKSQKYQLLLVEVDDEEYVRVDGHKSRI